MVAAVYDIDAVNLGEVVPVMRNNSARKANPGLFPFFLTSRPFRISLGRLAPLALIFRLLEILLELAITLCDLLPGKTHNLPALASARTVSLLASCPPDTAGFVLRSPSPEDPTTQPVYGDRVRPLDGFEDGLSGHSADIAQYIGQLDIRLRQRLLYPLDV